jgi:hypothetical protein
MIKKSTSQYGQAVSTIKAPKGAYGTDAYVLRNRKGEHVGTLCLTANGAVTLASADGYQLTDAPPVNDE